MGLLSQITEWNGYLGLNIKYQNFNTKVLYDIFNK